MDPPLAKDQEALESSKVCVATLLQELVCRIAITNSQGDQPLADETLTYQLLDSTGLTTLSAELKIAKLCFLHKIVNHVANFLSSSVT